jgi:hypothetical protein
MAKRTNPASAVVGLTTPTLMTTSGGCVRIESSAQQAFGNLGGLCGREGLPQNPRGLRHPAVRRVKESRSCR